LIWIKDRLWFVWVCAALIALSGCGAGSGSTASEGQESGARTVKHAMGETQIKGTPERVVVLDTGELDSAITLGVKPVGAVEAIPGEGFPSYLKGPAR
jgi:iron complex transport system substrate-binding protein